MLPETDCKVTERCEPRCEVFGVDCRCPKELLLNQFQELQSLVDSAKRILKTASDPISAVVHFLHERPEEAGLPGYVIDKVLQEVFPTQAEVPGLVKLLAGHVKEISRKRNVIAILKEHPAAEKWGSYLIKQADKIKFEVARERDRLVLRDIGGLVAVEHGIEVPLEKILINPPKLEVTLRLGILRPQRVVDIA